MTFQTGVDQAFFGLEVIARRSVIALTSRESNFAQRDCVYSVFREKLLGCPDDR
jgi:hypothetical protein